MSTMEFRGAVWGDMPDDFPTEPLETHYRTLLNALPTDSRARRLLGLGLKGVAYRFRSMAESDEDFREIITRHGVTPPLDEHFAQEKSLFGFFIAGMSCIDCLFYSLHALGGHYAPERFSLENESLRGVRPSTVVEAYEAAWPNTPLTLTIRCMIDSAMFSRWTRVRNVLTHRAVPPRLISIAPGRDADVTWQVEEAGTEDADERIDDLTTAPKRLWLSAQLRLIASALADFMAARGADETGGAT